jgi:hypothetical protein
MGILCYFGVWLIIYGTVCNALGYSRRAIDHNKKIRNFVKDARKNVNSHGRTIRRQTAGRASGTLARVIRLPTIKGDQLERW